MVIITNQEEDNEEGDSDGRRRSVLLEITKYNINTPLINCLVNIIIGYRRERSSTHVAALIPCNKECFNKKFNSLIITRGINSDKTKYGNMYVKTHAEMDALRKACNMLKCGRIKTKTRMNLIVLRINGYGNLSESAPCYHCTMELAKSKQIIINKLYFSTDEENIVCTKFSDWVKNPPLHVTKGWKLLMKINTERQNKNYKIRKNNLENSNDYKYCVRCCKLQ